MSEFHENIDKIFLNYLDGRNTPEELQLLRKWADQDMENIRMLKHFNDIYQASSVLNDRHNPDSHSSWMELKKKCEANESGKNSFRFFYLTLKIAASIAIIFLSGILINHFQNKISRTNRQSFSEYHIPRGSRSHIFLPDGTSVWLNAGSTLKYNQDFGSVKREVILEGEAYFDVVRDELKPFMVKAGDAVVKVLGTAFNVKAYPEEGFIETTVERGKVQVSSPGISLKGQEIITLTANQKIKISKDNITEEDRGVARIHSDSTGRMTEEANPLNQIIDFSENISASVSSSWKDPEWIIEHEFLKELAIQMERRYNVEIIFKDMELEKFVFSGKLKDESLEQVLDAISIAAPVKYSINQKQIFFYKK